MYTNLNQHGGAFSVALDTEFQNADNITIASGYTSLSTINQFQARLIDIARNGGESKLLLGMARYDGLEKHHLDCVTRLHDTLQNYNVASGVYIANKRPYHGKIYKFDSNGVSNFYVGSSNFSVNGIQKNIECTGN
ncbi:MAG: phospholipase D family protein [Proteobacteria bacterium]|nr:phospholipase D family protein [Pseudomonadota bacterium]